MKKIVNKLAIVMAMMALLLVTGVVVSATERYPAYLVIENNKGETVKLECQSWSSELTWTAVTWTAVENGKVAYVCQNKPHFTGEEEAKGYYILLKPNEGYMTASAYVKTANGNRQLSGNDYPNVFPYSADASDAAAETLVVSFRRYRVELSEQQMALTQAETALPTASIMYTDGETNTRKFIKFTELTWTSSNKDVANVENGKLVKTGKDGFARIEAWPTYGNPGDKNEAVAYFYVLVEANKTNSVGTIQLNSLFSEKAFMTEGNVGTSFLSLQYNGTDMEIGGFGKIYAPVEYTEKEQGTLNSNEETKIKDVRVFYDKTAKYTGSEGTQDPITFYAATAGEGATEDQIKQAREDLANSLFKTLGREEKLIVKEGDVVTFGNYGEVNAATLWNLLINSDFGEAVLRAGKSWELKKMVSNLLEGRIDLDVFTESIKDLAEELAYDFSNGYNPFNYASSKNGITVNYELYKQALDTDYSDAVGIRTKITQIELDAMLDYLHYNNNYELLTNNSANVAVGAWNLINAGNSKLILENSVLSETDYITMPAFVKYNILIASSSLIYEDNAPACYSEIGVIKPEAKAQSTTITGSTIQPLFGAFKNNLMFQILSLEPGEVYATNKSGEWSSTDPLTVYVNQQGIMKAWQTGFAFVSCTGDLSFFAYLVLVR